MKKLPHGTIDSRASYREYSAELALLPLQMAASRLGLPLRVVSVAVGIKPVKRPLAKVRATVNHLVDAFSTLPSVVLVASGDLTHYPIQPGRRVPPFADQVAIRALAADNWEAFAEVAAYSNFCGTLPICACAALCGNAKFDLLGFRTVLNGGNGVSFLSAVYSLCAEVALG